MQFSIYRKRDHEPSLLQFLPENNDTLNIHKICDIMDPLGIPHQQQP
jgi:hypothetical protein